MTKKGFAYHLGSVVAGVAIWIAMDTFYFGVDYGDVSEMNKLRAECEDPIPRTEICVPRFERNSLEPKGAKS